MPDHSRTMTAASPIPRTLGATADALADGSLSCVQLIDATLHGIAARDGALGAFLHVDAERARSAARSSDARRAGGAPLSALDGVPVAVKDNIVVRGMPATAGSKILEGFVPAYDATAVERLQAAGAIIVGKTNCDAFGMGSATENSAFGRTGNPWDPGRTPGGSSGGSAAAVGGPAPLLCAALGSDTGGSVRQPAAFCGVVGVKPTYGRVSRYGLIAFASSLDAIGTLAPDVAGAALLLETIGGPCARDATASPQPMPALYARARAASAEPVARTVGIPRALLHEASASARAAVAQAERALRARGAAIVEVDLPQLEHAVACYYVLCMAEASSNLARYDGVRFGARTPAAQSVEEMMASTRGALLGDEVKRRIVLGTWVLKAGYVDAVYGRAQRVRRVVSDAFRSAFARCDIMLLPTTVGTAFLRGAFAQDPVAMYRADLFTVPASLAGLPAVHVPTGFASDGLPVGAQLVGKPFHEEELLGVAAALEAEMQFLTQTPPAEAPGAASQSEEKT